LPTDLFRTIGHAEWSAPYESLAPIVLGSSAIAPLTLAELSAIARVDPKSFLGGGVAFDYTPPGGSAELRQLIAATMPGVIADNITVTVGAGEALAMVAELACHPDGHIVIETPAHESALATAQKTGCAVTLIQAPVTAEQVIGSLRPNTRAVFLASPHNPTGQVLRAEDLSRIAAELDLVGAFLVVDEVYRGLPMGLPQVPPAVAALAPNGVSVGSLSKVYGLPGLRLGWVAGPTLMVDDVRSMQRLTSRSPAATNEIIAKIALDNSEELLCRAKSLVYDSYAELSAICDRSPVMRLTAPDGGTTVFPEIGVADVNAWCGRVAEQYGVLVAPGTACFGVPGRIRINLGLRPEVRAKAFPLLAQALMATPKLRH
jgi:aspartate/methionine/tyrosine aminotransferase